MRKLGKPIIVNMPSNILLRIESYIYTGYPEILYLRFFVNFTDFSPKWHPVVRSAFYTVI